MKSSTAKKSYLAAAALMMALGLVGCSAGGESTPPAAPDSSASDEATGTEDGNDGRAFDSTDDAVITAISAALDPDDITWEGKTLMVSFNSGSVGDPTAGTGCLAITTLVADDEKGIISYPDGEIDCSTK